MKTLALTLDQLEKTSSTAAHYSHFSKDLRFFEKFVKSCLSKTNSTDNFPNCLDFTSRVKPHYLWHGKLKDWMVGRENINFRLIVHTEATLLPLRH